MRLPSATPSALARLRARAIDRSLFAPTGLYEAIAQLGFVQMDPIRAPARAQDLILRHRVAGYRCGDLERDYPRLPLAEDMLHVYGIMPLEVQRLLHPRVEGRGWHVEREHPELARSVLRHLRKNGATHPSALEKALGAARMVNAWGGQSSAGTRMLEALHHRGLLRVRRRDKGIKVYEMRGRRPGPLAASTRARGVLALILQLYSPLAETTLKRVARLASASSLTEAERTTALARLLEDGTLERARVDGERYLWPAADADPAPAPERVRLLAPFDPVVWDRRRFEHLWGWAYRFEAYTPAARRSRGYYALPLLWRDAVIGWANVVARPRGVEVAVGFAVRRPSARAFPRELDLEVGRLEAALRPRALTATNARAWTTETPARPPRAGRRDDAA